MPPSAILNPGASKAGVNLPLVEDKFAVRFAGAVREQDEGFTQGLNDSESYTRDRYLLKGQFQWQITDSADLRVIVDTASTREACCDGIITAESILVPNGGGTGAAFLAAGLPANGGVTFAGPGTLDDRRSLTEQPIENNTDQTGISAELNWDIGEDMLLTYIGGFRIMTAIPSKPTSTASIFIACLVKRVWGLYRCRQPHP